jgi:hypothetical protein
MASALKVRSVPRETRWGCHIRRACCAHLGVIARPHAPALVFWLPLPTRHHPARGLDVLALHAQLPRCRTGITAYLKNGGTLEKAAMIANHASTHTTQLYHRRNDEVSLDEVERILI